MHRKAHGPRGSVEGRPRVNVAVLIGCQVSAGWHAPRRLTARIVMPPRDGNASAPPCVDNGARSLYICADTCRHADPADGTRGHVTPPDHDPPDRLSVAEEAAMIDLAAYGLEPLHQDSVCLLSRGQLRGRRAE